MITVGSVQLFTTDVSSSSKMYLLSFRYLRHDFWIFSVYADDFVNNDISRVLFEALGQNRIFLGAGQVHCLSGTKQEALVAIFGVQSTL